MTPAAQRQAIRDWVHKVAAKKFRDEPKLISTFNDATPLVGIVSSLRLIELVSLIGTISGRAIDVDELEIESFATIDSICATFFEEPAQG
jgi:hypothetical protein